MAKSNGFTWLSLGGVGEIGKNCYAIEFDDKIFVLDVGMSFPTAKMFGVDIVIPDFSYLIKNQHRIAAIILTHGHEDHIGSLPYLLQDLNKIPPIYGAKFTLALAQHKLSEFGLGDTPLHTFAPGEDFAVGGVRVQTIRVTHSIPDTTSIAIDTPGGVYVHSADFKFDPSPVDGKLTDFAKFERIAKEGVLAFAVDTTNIEMPGHGGSESSVAPELRKYVEKHNGRVFVTTFASNIHRLQQVVDVAVALRRKVLLLGRTMLNNIELCQNLGYIKIPPGTLVSPQEADRLPGNKLMVMLTGSQGEPLAAISRIANRDHRFVTVRPDDLFIFSARPIPGNETAIFSIIDELFRQGAEVLYGINVGLHVSGHGYQDEIRQFIDMLDPDVLIPHHGMFRMQMRCKKLAEQWGFDPENVPIVEIGQKWQVDGSGVSMIDRVKSGEIYIAGDGMSDVSGRVINERLSLAEDGVLVFSVTLTEDGSAIVAGPHIMSKGFKQEKEAPELFNEITAAIRDSIARNRLRGPEHALQLRNNVQNVIQRIIFQRTRINPVVLGMVSYAGQAAAAE